MEKEEVMEAGRKGIFKTLIIFLKGLMMGCADVIPGVSGGTIALITGIYPRLIEAINSVFSQVNPMNLKNLLRFNIKQLIRNLSSVDFRFLIPLALGIMTALIALSNIIHYVMEHYTAITYAFFFGLIFASAVFLYKKLDYFRGTTILLCIIGFIFGFIIVGIGTFKANHSLLIFFFSGSIAITAMILPGISGAFMLIMLNQYDYALNILRTFSIKEILVFGAGGLLGLLVFSKVLNYLLHKHKSKTFGFLIGLMLGSLRLQCTIINGQTLTIYDKIGVAIAVIIGFFAVYILARLSLKHKGII